MLCMHVHLSKLSSRKYEFRGQTVSEGVERSIGIDSRVISPDSACGWQFHEQVAAGRSDRVGNECFAKYQRTGRIRPIVNL